MAWNCGASYRFIQGTMACQPVDFKVTAGKASLLVKLPPRLLHPNVFSQEGGNVQVLTFDDGRLAFFEPAACHRFELQDLLLGSDLFFRDRLCFYRRFFTWHDQPRPISRLRPRFRSKCGETSPCL